MYHHSIYQSFFGVGGVIFTLSLKAAVIFGKSKVRSSSCDNNFLIFFLLVKIMTKYSSVLWNTVWELIWFSAPSISVLLPAFVKILPLESIILERCVIQFECRNFYRLFSFTEKLCNVSHRFPRSEILGTRENYRF